MKFLPNIFLITLDRRVISENEFFHVIYSNARISCYLFQYSAVPVTGSQEDPKPAAKSKKTVEFDASITKDYITCDGYDKTHKRLSATSRSSVITDIQKELRTNEMVDRMVKIKTKLQVLVSF